MPHVDLLDLPYFQGISFDAVISLVDLMQPNEFKPGETIVKEGEGGPPPLYIATTGQVEITKRTSDRRERRLAQLTSPTLFGEIELFCQIAPVTTARAITRVHAFALTRHTYDQLFKAQHPAVLGFTLNVARVACHRLAIADTMLAKLLEEEDLVNMRRTVFAEMHNEAWYNITGTFRRPQLPHLASPDDDNTL